LRRSRSDRRATIRWHSLTLGVSAFVGVVSLLTLISCDSPTSPRVRQPSSGLSSTTACTTAPATSSGQTLRSIPFAAVGAAGGAATAVTFVNRSCFGVTLYAARGAQPLTRVASVAGGQRYLYDGQAGVLCAFVGAPVGVAGNRDRGRCYPATAESGTRTAMYTGPLSNFAGGASGTAVAARLSDRRPTIQGR